MTKRIACCILSLLTVLLTGCAKKQVPETRLSPPGSLKISAGNILTWSVVKGATAYLPNINGTDLESVKINRLDLSEIHAGSHLSIKVKALAGTSGLEDSAWSETLEYDKAAALAVPDIQVAGRMISWEAVEGALQYEYEINGSTVITKDLYINLDGYPQDTYTIRVRALPENPVSHSPSDWSAEVTVSVFSRLATPTLTVVSSSLKNLSGARVSWDDVEGASGYEVYVDNVLQECEGNTIDFSGKTGTFQVKVIAVNPGIYDESEAAVAVVVSADYGKGTKEVPYKIYSAQDWNDFSEIVSTDVSKAGYDGMYLEVMADIDFNGAYVTPAGSAEPLLFKGTLDGKQHCLRNAKIGDGTSSHQAFFYLLKGTVKNLSFDSITVNAGNASGAGSSAAVVVAGNSTSAFTLQNCHVTNSSVLSGAHEGNQGGSYAAGLVARCNNSSVSIKNCSVTGTTISAAYANAGGLVGYFGAGTIDNVKSSGNSVTAQAFSYAGGVVGGMSNGLLINAVSQNNICTVGRYSCGGVIGACLGSDGKVINVLSEGNTVRSTFSQQSLYYLGGLIGGAGNSSAVATVANCLVLSGSATYDYTPASSTSIAGCIGIAIGYNYVNGGTNTKEYTVSNSFIHQAYRTKYDQVWLANEDQKEFRRDAVGIKQNTYTGESRGGILGDFVRYLETPLTDGTVLSLLNDWVEENKSSYPQLVAWQAGVNNFPTIDIN